MNDVRKLMDTLRGDVEYREFNTPAAPAARKGGWALLDRLDRAAPTAAAVEPVVAEAILAPEPEPALATQMREAAAARSTRGVGRLKLGKYAPETAAQPSSAGTEDARTLPLAEVFARLAQGR